jgi:hypothetical protein
MYAQVYQGRIQSLPAITRHDCISIVQICNCRASIGHKQQAVGIPPRDATSHDQGQGRKKATALAETFVDVLLSFTVTARKGTM